MSDPALQPITKTAVDWPSDLADLHRLNPSRYPFLLESTAHGDTLGRYDLLFACPQESLRLNADFSLSGPASSGSGQFLETLDQWWSEVSLPMTPQCELPFTGGWFLLLGYELAQQIEPSLKLQAEPNQPIAVATRVPMAVIRDHRERQAWIMTESGHEARIDTIMRDLENLSGAGTRDVWPGTVMATGLTEENPDRFIHAIERAQRYISAGDIFQANLSRRWHGRLLPGVLPVDIYQRLRRSNPSPFAGLAVHEDFSVISSSPERLLRITGDRAETRPIAGTRPRSTSSRTDTTLREELLESDKERAEHVMVIDLERNDLGRICRAGSVEVDEFMAIESYPHVHHIVSNICGRLKEDATPGKSIAALFPGGSITGCPKVRCMEIINELEDRPRGMYTGAMGYINRDGSGDLSILIRCMTTAGSRLSLSTGSGIVTDSVPEQELAETRAKAKGLILALTQY